MLQNKELFCINAVPGDLSIDRLLILFNMLTVLFVPLSQHS